MLETDFLLYVSSSAWISYYIFGQLFTIFEQLTTKWHGGHLHADKGGKQVQHKPEHHGNNLHTEQGGDNVQLNQEHYGDHLHEKEGEDQVQLNPERHNGHLQGEDSSRG